MSPTRARILLLDEHRPSLAVLKLVLTGRGHVCECVETAEEALKAMASFAPDIVLYEWHLSRATGRGFARAARSIAARQHRRIVIVAISTQEEPEHFRATEDVDDYLTKPYQGDSLDRVIEHAIVALRRRT